MNSSFIKNLPLLLLATSFAMMTGCGKKEFNIATAPPDVGGSKDSASQLIDTSLKFDVHIRV